MQRRSFLQFAGLSAVLPWMLPRVSASQPATAQVFALRGDGKVVVIDPLKETIVALIETGGKGGTLGSLTSDLRKLYVANNAPGERTLVVLDTEQLTVRKQLETGHRPKHPLVDPRGQLVALNHSGLDDGKLRIAFVETATDEIARTVSLPVENTDHPGDFSMHGAWSTDGDWFAIGSYADNRAYVIEAATGRWISAELPGNPHYFDWQGQNRLYVTVEANEPKGAESRPAVVVLSFDPAAGTLTQTAAMQMMLSDEESTNPAQIEGHHANLTVDGRYLLCCNRGVGGSFGGGSLCVFDAASGELVKHFALGINGAGHAYLSPDGRFAVITQYNDTKLPVIDLSTLQQVALIDAESGGHLGHAVFTEGDKLFVSNRKGDEVLVIDTISWQIRNRIRTAESGQAQGMVLNRPYAVFERVGTQAFL